ERSVFLSCTARTGRVGGDVRRAGRGGSLRCVWRKGVCGDRGNIGARQSGCDHDGGAASLFRDGRRRIVLEVRGIGASPLWNSRARDLVAGSVGSTTGGDWNVSADRCLLHFHNGGVHRADGCEFVRSSAARGVGRFSDAGLSVDSDFILSPGGWASCAAGVQQSYTGLVGSSGCIARPPCVSVDKVLSAEC